MYPARTSMSAAGDTNIIVEGNIRLKIKIGGPTVSSVFGVASKLATKKVLRTAFTDNKIFGIMTNHWQAVAKGRHKVAIVESFED